MPKGFFRRAAALGCALLLCGGRALAEEFYTINEVRQQAAAGWHETYEAYGRTIVADVEPEIPNVTQIPIEKLEFARMTPRVTEEETGLQFVIRPEENVFGFYTRDFIEQVPNKIEKTTGLFLGYPSEWERAYAEGSDLTLSGMTDVVRKALALMQLDESSWDLEHPYDLSFPSPQDQGDRRARRVYGFFPPEGQRYSPIKPRRGGLLPEDPREHDHPSARFGHRRDNVRPVGADAQIIGPGSGGCAAVQLFESHRGR